MVQEKKEKKKINIDLNSDYIFKILVILLIITTITLIVVWLTHRGNPVEENPTIAELHNYFSTDDLTDCDGLFNYSSSKVDYESVSEDIRLCIAYHKSEIKNTEDETLSITKKTETCKKDEMIFKAEENTEECKITKINKDIIDNTYKKIFGKDATSNEKFVVDSTHTCYRGEDYYYCGLSEVFTYILGGSTIYRAIKDYEEKGSELIVYDYFIKINDVTCYANYTTDTINQKCTKKYKRNKKIKYNFMKKYGNVYKHIYQKAEDGTYYWVSSEPI